MNEKKQSNFKNILNQLEDLKSFLPPINTAGYPFIILFALVALILSLLSDFLGWIGFILTLWCVYFFRDPERVLPEKKGWQPAVILGTSHDDFNEIQSQSYYGTVSKFLGEAGGFRFSPFLGAAFIEELSDLRPVGGIHIRNGVWSAMFSHSGTDEHLSISRQLGNHSASFVYWGLKYPGLAWTYRF